MAAKEAAAAARKAVAKAESLESEIAALKAAIGQQRDPALLSQQEQEQLEQKPGLKAQHDLAASVLKLAAAYEAHVSKCTIIGGNATNNIGVRVEDSIRLATVEKCYIEPNILFTPNGTASNRSVYQGAISDHADAGDCGQLHRHRLPARHS